MKTAIITSIDDNMIENLESDFLDTLRNTAKYKGEVFVVYYGRNKKLASRLGKKYNIKIIFARKKFQVVPNQRDLDFVKLLENIPDITHVMCIDGGDVWFQAPIDKVFEITKNSYGFVEEDSKADKGFNLECISKIKDKKFRNSFLKKARNFRLINAGMIVGEKNKIKSILEKKVNIINKINQDFFALDQTILNYIIRSDRNGIILSQKYNYSLMTKQNQFQVIKKLFYDENNKLISIVHNTGSSGRLLLNGRKDMIDIPKFPKKLPGTFWGITTFFNPIGYKNKLENYKIFRESSKKQGLKLLTVELAFGNKPFELKKEDAEILIQIRAKNNNILWQKERLINIGIKNLPKDCDKFAWLDADIIFCNNNWIKETCKLLESYAIVQPFDSSIRLPKGVYYLNPEKRPFNLMDKEGFKNNGIVFRVAQFGKQIIKRDMNFSGHAGFAWVARKSIFEKFGVFDKGCLNSDSLMSQLFYNNKLNPDMTHQINKYVKKKVYLWAKKIRKNIKGSIYFAKGTVLHLWHGKTKNRNLCQHERILIKNNFNPDKDIKIDYKGVWAWNSNKPKLHREIKNYFLMRNEENSFLFNVCLLFNNLPEFKTKLLIEADRDIGLIGLYLKENYPEIYYKLKRLKSFAGLEKQKP